MIRNLVTSLVFGASGSYEIFGIKVDFQDPGVSLVRRLANGIFLGAYLEFFIHEIGHSIAYKWTCGNYGEIALTSRGGAVCFSPTNDFIPSCYEALITMSGPLMQSTWHVIKSSAAHFAFKSTTSLKKYRILNTIRRISLLWIKYQTYFWSAFSVAEIGYFLLSMTGNRYQKRDPAYIYEETGILGLMFSSSLYIALEALSVRIIRKIA